MVLYEYLGEEYPEVLGSILGGLKASRLAWVGSMVGRAVQIGGAVHDGRGWWAGLCMRGGAVHGGRGCA